MSFALLLFRAEANDTSSSEELKKVIAAKARTLLEEGKYGEAIQYFNGMIVNYPDVAGSYYYLGLAHYGNNDVDSAEKNFKKAIELDPYYPDAFYHLALIEFRRGNNPKVVEYLNEVTSLDNTFQSAYYNKGVVFLAMDIPKRAMKEFAYSLYLDPTDANSLAGILNAAERLNMLEKETLERSGNMEFSSTSPDRDNGTEDADVPNEADQLNKAMRIEVITESGYKELDRASASEISVESTPNINGACEIIFDSPADLDNRTLRFKIKGAKGAETVSVLVRDDQAKRSPFMYLSDITPVWKAYSIELKGMAGNINLSHVDMIRFELLFPESSADEKQTVTFADITIE